MPGPRGHGITVEAYSLSHDLVATALLPFLPTRMKTSGQPGPLHDSLRALRTGLFATFCFSAVITALLLTPSIYMLQVYDRVLSSRSEWTLLLLSLMVLGLYAVLAMLEHVRGMVLTRLSVRLDRSLSDKVFRAAFEHVRHGGGSPGAATQDLVTLRQFVASPVPALFFDAPLALVFLIAAFVVDVWLGVFVTASIVILGGLAWLSERLSRPWLRDAAQAANRAAAYVDRAFRNVDAIRALGMLDAIRLRWQDANQHALQCQDAAASLSARVGAIGKFVRLAAQSLALGLGALLVLEDRITPGMMIAATILLGRALTPIEGLMLSLRQLVGAQDAQRRLGELLRHHAHDAVKTPLPAPQGLLQVDRLHVGTPGNREAIIREVSLLIRPGQVLGVIGPSASGKSTLARALVGVWTPLAGSVRLDGAELGHWPERQLADAIGFLPQDVELFDGTVAENIARFSSGEASAIVDAGIQAGAHDMILKLPQGYDTPIGAGDMVLSGGQRQRIGLARAVYGRPVLLVLDEPNSNLDDVGETALLQTVLRVKQRGGTVVVISHRRAILEAADRLLVMREGAVALHGPAKDIWQELARLQGRRTSEPVQQLAAREAS